MSTSTSSNRKRRTSKGEKARRQVEQEAEEERLLTASLFGGDSSAALLGRTQPQTVRLSKNESAPWFSLEIDRVGDATVDDDDDDNNGLKRGSEPTRQESLQRQDRFSLAVAAWVDEDDELAQLGLVGGPSRLKKLRLERSEQEPLTGSELHSRLRNRFQTTTQLTAHTEWANLKSNDQNISVSVEEKTEANEFDNANNSSYLSTSTTLLEPTSGHHSSMLPPNILNIKRCPDANISDVSKAALQVVQFHPGSDPDKPILLAAGFDKSLRFFSVSENSSTKLHGMHFPKLPIYSASFLGKTGTVVVTGRRSFFYLYDSVAGKVDTVSRIAGRPEKSWERCVASPDGRTLAFCGNDGYVVLYDVARRCSMNSLKLNGSVRSIAFNSPDGREVIASGSDGDVYRWDLRSQRCLDRFANSDGTIASSMAATSRTLAVGAESGVVNLYSERQERPDQLLKGSHSSKATPLKSVMNLKTSADLMRFNSDGQILAMSSRREKSALKLLHVPTRTVFSNWPTSKTPLGYAWSMDFSPDSKFFAIGNDQGKCMLYKLLHYEAMG